MVLLYGPGVVGLARGNHEDRDQHQAHVGRGGRTGHDIGFHLDCDFKYGPLGLRIYDAFCEMFTSLPLAHVIEAPEVTRKGFVVHGGLFMEQNVTVPMLQRIHRFRGVPVTGTRLDDRLFTQVR